MFEGLLSKDLEHFASIDLHFNILVEMHFVSLSFILALLRFVHFNLFARLLSSFDFLSLIAQLRLMHFQLDTEFGKPQAFNVYDAPTANLAAILAQGDLKAIFSIRLKVGSKG